MLRGMAKLFTLDEANALLPRLREILEELRRNVAALEETEADATRAVWKLRSNGHNPSDEAFAQQRAARESVSRLISRVNELGCELKDPRSGLIDFPSLRDGRTVYLCWKLDEPAVAFWHPIETGFAGRQPL